MHVLVVTHLIESNVMPDSDSDVDDEEFTVEKP